MKRDATTKSSATRTWRLASYQPSVPSQPKAKTKPALEGDRRHGVSALRRG